MQFLSQEWEDYRETQPQTTCALAYKNQVIHIMQEILKTMGHELSIFYMPFYLKVIDESLICNEQISECFLIDSGIDLLYVFVQFFINNNNHNNINFNP